MKPVELLTQDLSARIDYWRKEASLTYAETIGALELIKADLIFEAREDGEKGDE
jgi:hypothetical protein